MAAAPRPDPLVHEPVRLLVLTTLAASGTVTFPELRRLVGASDGNLGIHARKLEDAGYVRAKKSFVGRVPRTELRLTSKGRAALARYAAVMRALLAGA